jgi:hypothetical protein
MAVKVHSAVAPRAISVLTGQGTRKLLAGARQGAARTARSEPTFERQWLMQTAANQSNVLRCSVRQTSVKYAAANDVAALEGPAPEEGP